MAFETLNSNYKNNISFLLEEIQRKNCCVFIGAGLSRPAGYPSWEELVNRLKEKAEIKNGEKLEDRDSNYYDRAEEYKRILGDDFPHLLIHEFNPNENKQNWMPIHLDIVQMPFVAFVTTNYDCLIENALGKIGQRPTYSFYPTLPRTHLRNRQVFHIHGIIDYHDLLKTQGSVIFTRSDIDLAYDQEKDSSLLDFLYCLYTELTILFIGFNINDPIMMRVLQNCYLQYQRKKEIIYEKKLDPIKEIQHYALLPYQTIIEENKIGERIKTDKIDLTKTEIEDLNLNHLGVKTIRYIGDGFNHTKLLNIMSTMNEIINQTSPKPISQDLTFRDHGV